GRGDGRPRHPAPASAARHPDERLTAAAGVAEPEHPVDAALEDPLTAALPRPPPPPPGWLESEPNGDASRSQRIILDAVHVGRLSDAGDDDFYRFHLANAQYGRFEALPDAPDSGWALSLDGEYLHPLVTNADGGLTLERWLLAGDHRLVLRGAYLAAPSAGYYQLRVAPLGALGLPIDLEPNDAAQSASL